MKKYTFYIFTCFLLGLGLQLFSQSSDKWVNYTNTDKVSDILVDGNKIWISTMGGLVNYNKQTGEKSFYTRAEGLPFNRVMGLTSDESGNIWLSCRDYGIAKFDGQSFQRFNSRNSEIPHDEWNAGIITDNNDNIWFGSLFWLARFNGSSWKQWDVGSIIYPAHCIEALCFDSDGDLWIGSAGPDGGLSKLINDTVKDVMVDSLRHLEISSFAFDDEGNLWIGSNNNNGLYKYNSDTCIRFTTSNSGLPSNTIYSLAITGNTKWIGTSKGLAEYDNSTFTVYDTSNSKLTSNFVSVIKPGDDDVLWIGTLYEGILKFKNGEFQSINIKNSSMQSNSIQYMAIDNSDNCWIYCYEGKKRVLKWDKGSWSAFNADALQTSPGFENIFENDKKILFRTENIVLDYRKDTNANCWQISNATNSKGQKIKIDDNNNIWMSTYEGLKKYDGNELTTFDTSNTPFPSNRVHLITLKNGDVIASIKGKDTIINGLYNQTPGELYRYDNKQWNRIFKCEKINVFIHTIDIDSKNNLWISVMSGGGSGMGIFKNDPSGWKNYNMLNSDIPYNFVLDIACTSNKEKLWISTGGAGIAEFDIQNNSWTNLTVLNSQLPKNWANCISVDSKNNVWIAANFNGLAIYNPKGIDFSPSYVQINELVAEDNKKLSVYPNPFQEQISIVLSLLNTAKVNITIYDNMGKLVMKKQTSKYPPGRHRIQLNLNNSFSPGFYYCKIQYNDIEETIKLLKE